MKLKGFFSRFHFSVTVILGFLVCLFIYLIVRGVSFRADFSSRGQITPSSETKKILSLFGSDKINVYSFFSSVQPEKEAMEELLAEYARVSSSFQFEMIDPDRSPAKAREFQTDSYGVTIVRARGREMRIESINEQDLSDALQKILSGFKRTVYIVTGHDEPKLNDRKDDGYLAFYHLLTGRGYEVKKLELSKAGNYKDVDLLILAGPHTDLSENELKTLESYMSSGGKLFLALDPVYEGEGENIKSFLLKHGIDLGNDVVIDKLSSEMGADYLVAMTTDYEGRALQDFRETALFPVTRSVKKYHQIPEGWTISEMMRTSLGSWAETNLKALEDGKVDYDEGVDFPGPISIGVIAQDAGHQKKMAVIGDSDFLTNKHIHVAGNYHLTLRIFAWLLEDASPQESKPIVPQTFNLTPGKQVRIFYFSILILPALFLLSGFLIYVYKKRFA